jgi:hypothetical protein
LKGKYNHKQFSKMDIPDLSLNRQPNAQRLISLPAKHCSGDARGHGFDAVTVDLRCHGRR